MKRRVIWLAAPWAIGLTLFALYFTPIGVYTLTIVYPAVSDFVLRRPFNSTVWRQDVNGAENRRVRMVDDLQHRVSLKGMTRLQAETLLGKPDMGDTANLTYRLGDERGFISIDSEWLSLSLDDKGVVQNVAVWRD